VTSSDVAGAGLAGLTMLAGLGLAIGPICGLSWWSEHRRIQRARAASLQEHQSHSDHPPLPGGQERFPDPSLLTGSSTNASPVHHSGQHPNTGDVRGADARMAPQGAPSRRPRRPGRPCPTRPGTATPSAGSYGSAPAHGGR
jgi:hypothetical protein